MLKSLLFSSLLLFSSNNLATDHLNHWYSLGSSSINNISSGKTFYNHDSFIKVNPYFSQCSYEVCHISTIQDNVVEQSLDFSLDVSGAVELDMGFYYIEDDDIHFDDVTNYFFGIENNLRFSLPFIDYNAIQYIDISIGFQNFEVHESYYNSIYTINVDFYLFGFIEIEYLDEYGEYQYVSDQVSVYCEYTEDQNYSSTYIPLFSSDIYDYFDGLSYFVVANSFHSLPDAFYNYDVAYQNGYDNGYQSGYADGSSSSLSNPFDIIRSALKGPIDLLSVEIVPNITIGTIVLIPLAITIIVFLLKGLVM